MGRTLAVILALFSLEMLGVRPQAQGSSLTQEEKEKIEGLSRILGEKMSFSATVLTTEDNILVAEGSIAVLDGLVRTETDMTKIMDSQKHRDEMTQLKEMGIDRSISVYHPKTKVYYLIYPGLSAYCEISMKADIGQPAQARDNIQRTETGKESVAGHQCIRYKAIVPTADGQKFECQVWEATDLKNLPVQLEFKEGAAATRLQFRDINRNRPNPKLFEVPAGYTRTGSYEELMTLPMLRMMQKQGIKPEDFR